VKCTDPLAAIDSPTADIEPDLVGFALAAEAKLLCRLPTS